jgi:hydrogenase maturation protease
MIETAEIKQVTAAIPRHSLAEASDPSARELSGRRGGSCVKSLTQPEPLYRDEKGGGMKAAETDERIVVIGYGSTLRGDDAVGRIVAEAIAAKRHKHVVAISVTQLVPELATLVASAQAVIFVDASVDDQQSVEVRELTPACPLSCRFHQIGPRELLALTRNCYGHSPLAWLVAVPGRNFQMTDRLTLDAERQVQIATREVEQLISQLARHEPSHT